MNDTDSPHIWSQFYFKDYEGKGVLVRLFWLYVRLTVAASCFHRTTCTNIVLTFVAPLGQNKTKKCLPFPDRPKNHENLGSFFLFFSSFKTLQHSYFFAKIIIQTIVSIVSMPVVIFLCSVLLLKQMWDFNIRCLHHY